MSVATSQVWIDLTGVFLYFLQLNLRFNEFINLTMSPVSFKTIRQKIFILLFNFFKNGILFVPSVLLTEEWSKIMTMCFTRFTWVFEFKFINLLVKFKNIFFRDRFRYICLCYIYGESNFCKWNIKHVTG